MSYVFNSKPMLNIIAAVQKVADSDAPVLITGESGVGKEVIVNSLHESSKRANNPLIKINCAALPKDLIESELFGSVKGSFTSSIADKTGLFRLASTGTLFLDEIAEMPIETQCKLLRVLEDREVRPIGSDKTFRVNTRIFAATNRSPKIAINERKLRPDLFYRLNVISFEIPPLRCREEDIVPLAQHFLNTLGTQEGKSDLQFAPEAIDKLKRYQWPGNVRELQNIIHRAILFSNSNIINANDIDVDLAIHFSGLLMDMEYSVVIRTIEQCHGNFTKAAKLLGISRQTLYTRLTPEDKKRFRA